MTTHPRPGDPVWIELMSDSLARSSGFYGPLFGWEFQDQGEEFGHYHLISAQQDTIAGGMDNAIARQINPDTPPEALGNYWSVYLRTDDAHALAERARAFGATVPSEPMELPGRGTMVVVHDPSVGVVGAWQPGAFGGTERFGAPGSPAWFEVESPDIERARALLADVFQWQVTEDDIGEGPVYYTNGAGADATAAVYDGSDSLPPGADARWHVYFCVDDVDTAVGRIQQLGGIVDEEPVDSPYGRLATARDTLGATFHLTAESAD